MASPNLNSTENPADQHAIQKITGGKTLQQRHATRKKSGQTSAAPLLKADQGHDKAVEDAPSTSGPSSQMPAALRLKTSKEVYDLVRTNPGYDGKKCHIVYHDRVADQYMRTAVADWTPASSQGDVPWHRVWFFQYDGTIFWDRERRIFDHSLLRRLASGEGAPSYENVTRGAQRMAETLPRDFRLVTLNLLAGGNFRKEVIPYRKFSDVTDVLRDWNADVIMLQGCTRETLESLQEQDWVCEDYEIVYSDLEPSGQITLARATHARASQHSLSASNKRALNVCFRTANGVDFEMWNVDLRVSPETARAPGSAERQLTGSGTEQSGTPRSGTDLMSQLEQRTSISGTYAAIVAGDFGFRGRKHDDIGPFSQSADRGWCDASLSCRHPGDRPVDEKYSSQAVEGQPGNTSRALNGSQRAVGGETVTSCRPNRIYTRSSQFVLKSARNLRVSESDILEQFAGVFTDVHVDPSRAVDDWERLGCA